jgi:hypothetical protein
VPKEMRKRHYCEIPLSRIMADANNQSFYFVIDTEALNTLKEHGHFDDGYMPTLGFYLNPKKTKKK